jgi:uncharacterized protein (DUF2147 family)
MMKIWQRIGPVLAILVLGVLGPGKARAAADNAVGLWRTEDGKGLREMFSCGERLSGRLAGFTPRPGSTGIPVDDNNPDPARRTQPLCGLMLMGDFRRTAEGAWEDGWIYDPKSGQTYHASVRPDGPDRLRLRGYVGIPLFGKTQVWIRAPADAPRCKAS